MALYVSFLEKVAYYLGITPLNFDLNNESNAKILLEIIEMLQIEWIKFISRKHFFLLVSWLQ